MRISIALKIFGVALTLLVMLAIASVFSTRNVGRVAGEVEAIGHYFTPLAQAASRIEIHHLQQALVFERVLQRYAAVARADSSVAQGEADFAEYGLLIGRELEESRQLIDEGFSAADSERDRIEFSQLRPAIATIAKEHQDYEDLARGIIRALDTGERIRAETLRELLDKEERELVAELDGFRATLQRHTLAAIQESAAHESRILRTNVGITALAAVSGLLFASLVTSGLMRPIRRLVQGTKAIEQGRLDTDVPVTSSDEIGALTQSFNHMVSELRVKERIKDTFGKYVDPRIVEDLLQRPEMVATGGERRIVTVFFSDIAGFTAIGENLTPGALVALINRYFTVMSEPITRHGGIVDKYIGDAIMAFWAPPFVPADEQATRACHAALAQVERLGEFRQMVPEIIGVRSAAPEINIRIGLATGDVVIGNIGSETIKGYTVMGDAVNLGSRLESAAKQYGVTVLMSEQTYRLASAAVEARELDFIRVTGKQEPARVFELLGRRGALDTRRAMLRDRFQEGLTHYRSARWLEAERSFRDCLSMDSADIPSQVFLTRVIHFARQPPGPEWDGVWTLAHK